MPNELIMECRILLAFLFVFSMRILMAFSLVLFMVGEGVAAGGRQNLRLEKYGDEPRHAPPVTSYVLSDGSSRIDCIPITGQIAAHHPLLTRHEIHLSPLDFQPRTHHQQAVPQLFAKEHGSCPDGSVPIMGDLATDLNQPRLTKFQGPRSMATFENPVISRLDSSDARHQWATTSVPNVPGAYSGGHSHLSVNQPKLGDESQDFTLSQIWIADGESDTFSTIEVGWQIYPSLYNKSRSPHLFVFWTNNNYDLLAPGHHGCYNLECAGFVQINSQWVIAGPFLSYTTLAQNASYEIDVEIEVFYSRNQFVWWLYLNNEPVGYWPASIYEGRLNGSASEVEWGGEVAFLPQPNSPVHSKTEMGSGAFPTAGYPIAAYHRVLSIIDAATGVTMDAAMFDLQGFRSNEHCYNIDVHEGPLWGTYFFFGGPGGNNVNCTMF